MSIKTLFFVIESEGLIWLILSDGWWGWGWRQGYDDGLWFTATALGLALRSVKYEDVGDDGVYGETASDDTSDEREWVIEGCGDVRQCFYGDERDQDALSGLFGVG